ncbi:hypothetical protein NDU88_000462 [Pleurodeles waltl]|uniref:C-type lectin domain-containing protein n=1 Tax=Pleurodeles waltl TaxID=8319 RepID=A0AAV7P9S1_PLEWA|nr:hypothetical protein NDU88_000462 [Pleurodeles waltl]
MGDGSEGPLQQTCVTCQKRPHAVTNPLDNTGVRTEEESLRSSEEPNASSGSPDNPITDRSHGAWMQGRSKEALIALLSVLSVIFLAIIVWLAVIWHRELQLRASLVPCPKDWIWTNGACYFFSIEKKSWNKSNEFCASHDGTLAIILDQYTLDTIKRYKTIDNSWIGLLRRDGVWLWVNGTLFSGSLLPMAEDVPNLHCAYLNEDKYGILDCASLRNWICIRNSSSSMAELPALG